MLAAALRSAPILFLPLLLLASASVAGVPAEERVGHEVIDIRNPPNLIVWGTRELSIEAYDALELPPGWLRNQPREGVADGGRFLRTPGRDLDGEFTMQEMFGVGWLHQATIVGLNGAVEPQNLLFSSTVEKHHELTWRAGSSITLLISPEDVAYGLVSRDARRTSDTPTIPDGWSLEAIALEEDLTILLPLHTTVIRADNQDSFQGPLPPEVLELREPVGPIDPDDQVPPPQLVEGRRLLLTDVAGSPERRRLSAILEGEIASPEPGSDADPTLHGGFAVIANRATGERDFFVLPAAGWRGLGDPAGSRGWLYRDTAGENGPCTRVHVRPGARLRLACRGADVDVSRDESSQGTLALGLALGPALTHCAEFGGSVERDEGTGVSRRGRGHFEARDAPQPVACPFLPMYVRTIAWGGELLRAMMVEGHEADAPILGRLGALNIHTIQDPQANAEYSAGVLPLVVESGATLLYSAEEPSFSDTSQGPDDWVQPTLAMPFYPGAQAFLGMLSRPEFEALLPLKAGQVGDTLRFAFQMCLYDCEFLASGALVPLKITGRLLAIHYSLDRASIEAGVPLLAAEAENTPGVALGWAGRVVANVHTILGNGAALPANTPFSGDGTLVYVLDAGVDPESTLALPELSAFVASTHEHVVALFE